MFSEPRNPSWRAETMTYQHCPRCQLHAIRCRASYLKLTSCPRCLARAGIVSPMFSSPLNAMELRGAEPDPPLPASVVRPGPRRSITSRDGCPHEHVFDFSIAA